MGRHKSGYVTERENQVKVRNDNDIAKMML